MLYYKNWLVNNIKDKKFKSNINRIELFDNKKLVKSLPLILLNNIKIKMEYKTYKKRIIEAQSRRENLLAVKIKKCKEFRDLFNVKRNLLNQNYQINKSFKNLSLNYKLYSANLSKNQQIIEKSEVRKNKRQEIQVKKIQFDQQKRNEKERKSLKIICYDYKMNQ